MVADHRHGEGREMDTTNGLYMLNVSNDEVHTERDNIRMYVVIGDGLSENIIHIHRLAYRPGLSEGYNTPRGARIAHGYRSFRLRRPECW